jgi:tetratricopeptide (TPR) repeat protein
MLIRALAGSLLALILTTGVMAQPVTFDAIQALLQAGRYAEAQAAVREYPVSDPAAQAVRERFVVALIKGYQGQYGEAERQLNALLADYPQASRIQLALAELYSLQQRHVEARALYQDLLALPELQDTTVQALQHRLTQLPVDKPWQVTGYVSLAPSSNLNQGTDKDMVVIGGIPFQVSENGQRSGGVGVAYGGTLTGQHRFAERWAGIVTGGLHRKDYTNNTRDETVLTGTVLVRYAEPGSTLDLGWRTTRQWYGTQPYLTAFGPVLAYRQALAPELTWSNTYSLQRQLYSTQGYRAGWQATTEQRLTRALNKQLAVYGLVGLERTTTQREHLDYWYGTIGAGAFWHSENGLQLQPELKLGWRPHDGAFPLTNIRREDQVLSASLALQHRRFAWQGWAPRLTYQYQAQTSNIGFYQWQDHDFGLSLVKVR